MDLGMNYGRLVLPQSLGDLVGDTPARSCPILSMGRCCLRNRSSEVRILGTGTAGICTRNHFTVMIMQALCNTLPSLPSSRSMTSNCDPDSEFGLVRSNATAPLPPDDVFSVATCPKTVPVHTPSIVASPPPRIPENVVFAAAS